MMYFCLLLSSFVALYSGQTFCVYMGCTYIDYCNMTFVVYGWFWFSFMVMCMDMCMDVFGYVFGLCVWVPGLDPPRGLVQ
jgi:membrane protein insertase Oxa1/YidC/SpoIIIJ